MKSPPTDESPAGNGGRRGFVTRFAAMTVGAIAGLVSRSKVVGFVGGMEVPLIRKFLAGYRAGVKEACPSCQVLSAYAGNQPSAFADPLAGKALATSEYGRGADIIFHASGKTGQGVFTAATQLGKLPIGTDATLREAVAPLEQRIGRDTHRWTVELLGADESRPGSRELVQATLDLVRGLGLASTITDDSARRSRILDEWADVLDRRLHGAVPPGPDDRRAGPARRSTRGSR